MSRVSLLFGGSIVGANVWLQGCGPAGDAAATEQAPASLFSAAELALLDEIGETILPTTPDSPGAKAVGIGAFMQTIVADCYTQEERQAFTQGLAELQQRCQAAYQRAFGAATPEQRLELLTELDAEALIYNEKQEDDNEARAKDARLDPLPPHYLTMLKQLTLWGYFTSETGAKEALRYVEVPGRYEGCIDYQPGDKAWALA